MHRPSNISTLLAVLTLMFFAGCGKKSPEELVASAKNNIQAGNYETAIIDLKNVLQNAPTNTQARLLFGQALEAQERWSDSEKELKKALNYGATPESVLPDLARTLFHEGKFQEVLSLEIPKYGMGSQAVASLQAQRAHTYISLNQPEAAATAIAEGEKALAGANLADISNDLQMAKARLAYVNHKFAVAMSLLDNLLTKAPKSIDALILKAHILRGENKNEAAIKVYQQILSINPKQLNAYILLAGMYQNAGNLDAADQTIKSAEKLGPSLPMVSFARASIDLRRGNFKTAGEAIQQVLRVMPDHPPSRLISAAVSFSAGFYEQSRKDAEFVLTRIPNSILAARLLAASQIRLNDVQGALKTLLPLVNSKNGADVALITLTGQAYLMTREYTRAMEFIERAAKLSQGNQDISALRAVAHMALGETSQGLADLEKAVSLSDKAGQVDIALITLLQNKGDYDQALKAIAAFEKKLPNNPVTYNLRADAFLGLKDVKSARKSLEKAVAIQPTFYPAVVKLAHLDLLENNTEAARKRYEALLTNDKNNLQAMLGLAEIAMRDKRESDYVAWLEKAGKAAPDALQPRAALVHYHLGKKDKQKAFAIARELIAAYPDSPEPYKILGAAQLATGDAAGAIATLTSLTQKVKNSPDALTSLAQAQLAGKQSSGARASLNTALKIKPDFLAAQDTLLGLEMAERKPQAALELARQIQRQQVNSPLGYEREGDIFLAEKKYPLAIKAFEQMVAKNPGIRAFRKLHRTMMLAGDGRADKQLTSWISSHPKDLDARLYAAEIYTFSGRDKEAIAQYETIVKSFPNNHEALNNLANLYQNAKDSRAIPTAEQALKLSPNNPGIMDTLGWILLEQGQRLPYATEILGKAAEMAPKAGSLRYHYSVALLRSGNKAQAKSELEKLMSGKLRFPEAAQARALLKTL